MRSSRLVDIDIILLTSFFNHNHHNSRPLRRPAPVRVLERAVLEKISKMASVAYSHVYLSIHFTTEISEDDESLSPDSFLVKVPVLSLIPGNELTVFQKTILSIVGENIVELHLQMNKTKKYKNESFNILAKMILKAYEASLDEDGDEGEEDDDDEGDDDDDDFSEKPAKKQKTADAAAAAAAAAAVAVAVVPVPVTDALGPEHFHITLNRSKTADQNYKKCSPVKLCADDKYLCVFAEME